MAFVSLTRLHLRSWRYFPPFTYYALRSAGHAKRSRGFIAGALGNDAEGGQWTMTMWESEGDMRAFRNSGAHFTVMPKLLDWCDEASFAHYVADTAALPAPEEAHRRLERDGHGSKVRHPSAAHAAGRMVSASLPALRLNLKPRV